MLYYYDFKKMQEVLDSGTEARVGMAEDWFWTAETLTQENIDNEIVAGITYSTWATPSILIAGEMHDCYVEKD